MMTLNSILSGALMALTLVPSAYAAGYGAPPADIWDRLDALVAAYPQHLVGHTGKEIIWRDGTRMPVSDGRTDKTFTELLNEPDIDDMFAFPYTAGKTPTAPSLNHDPGRIRYQPFFLKMYGDCRSGNPERVTVKWIPRYGGGTVSVSPVNGVHKAISAVSAELEKLAPKFIRYLKPTAGTYTCRQIAGTQRLSMHSFAVAIDINVSMSHYWRWTKPNKEGKYPWRNNIPEQIVEVFERHGFIWGGRWYHYDTMHFEFRPEFFQHSRR